MVLVDVDFEVDFAFCSVEDPELRASVSISVVLFDVYTEYLT